MTAPSKPDPRPRLTCSQVAYDNILRDQEKRLRSELQRIVGLRERGFEGNSFDEESR